MVRVPVCNGPLDRLRKLHEPESNTVWKRNRNNYLGLLLVGTGTCCMPRHDMLLATS